MNEEDIKLYMSYHCKLLCPFPLLEVYRRNPEMLADNYAEYCRLLLEEELYLKEREKIEDAYMRRFHGKD